MITGLLLILLILLCLVGILLAAFQLPGNWLVFASALGYDAYYHWQRFGWKWLALFGVMALAGEIAELLSSAIAAKRAGASRRAGLAALVGGFAGMLILSIPIPIIGTIVGGMIGCFSGALIAEMTLHDDLAKGTRVGLFATLGRLIGLVAKLALTLAMSGGSVALALYAAWRP